jgi:hypothetical protein
LWVLKKLGSCDVLPAAISASSCSCGIMWL